jgi:hypothetical protein
MTVTTHYYEQPPASPASSLARVQGKTSTLRSEFVDFATACPFPYYGPKCGEKQNIMNR